jgi:N-acetylmuramoyl-L-alanine amidase
VTPAILALPLLAAVSSEPIVLLLEGHRRELAPVVRGQAEMVVLDQILPTLGVAVHSDAAGGAVTLTYQGREVGLYNRKSLASVGGDLRLLSAPALLEDRRWLIPVDAVPRLLGPLLGRPVDWRPASRVLVIGDVSVPRIGVETFVSGDTVRVVLAASEKLPFRVLQEEQRVTVAVQRDVVDVAFQQERLTGGIVEWVRYVGGRENLFAVTLGRRFQSFKAYELESPARLVLEFQAAPAPARAATPPTSPAAPRKPEAEEPRVVRTVVVDPGHGGEEVGAKGPGGTLEKDVTLAIARKLKAAITNSLGYQVFLTREADQDIPLDERTAIANNYKADLFVSIHANASRSHGASGSEVYFLSYQASDDESRRLALAEGAVSPLDGDSPAPPGSDLALILWDMAQAEHLEESSALASRIQEELAEITGSEGRGVKQAPFRVLVGAAMPAVLVEVAFISHPEEEKLLVSDAFQSGVAAALMRGIAKYERERAGRLGLLRPATSSGS